MAKTSIISNTSFSDSIETTFSNSYTVSSPVSLSFMDKLKSLVNNNKFKWSIVFLLLLVGIFFYLKMENSAKQSNNPVKVNEPINNYQVIPDNNGNKVVVNMDFVDNFNTTTEPVQVIEEMEADEKIENENVLEENEEILVDTNNSLDSDDVIRNIEQLDDTESEQNENFIESNILREQELTVEELNAINRQLEESNFDRTVMMSN